MGKYGGPQRVSKIHEKFKPLYFSKKRYFILTGGRGGMKTYSVHEYIARLTYEKGHGVLFTRYTMVTAEKSIIPEFTGTLNRLAIIQDFTITKTHIVNDRTGSFIYFSGIKTSSGDQTANLKSLPGITTWIIEEGEDYNDEKSFIDIDDSIRKKGVQNRVIWIQNPAYAADSFIYKRFYVGHEVINTINYLDRDWVYTSTNHLEVENIHTTYTENLENLNPDKVAQWDRIALKDPDFFQHKYIGGWLTSKEGALFDKKTIQRFDSKDFNLQNVEAVISFIDVADRGTDSLSMPIGFLISDQVYIYDWYFSKDGQDITIPEIAAKAIEMGIEHMAVEVNGLGLNYLESLEKSVGCLTYPFSQQANKHSRIIQNSGFIRNYFVFRSDYEAGGMYDKAMRELFAYNKDDKLNRKGGYNDDAPDGITGLWIVCKDLFPERWI
tara:strand:+ start:190 stop:1503 length:1314 start_codon:yes stop_codon:yes gene_type:complete